MIRELLKEAFILKNKGYYKLAIETFYKVLEIESASLETLLEISECYYKIGDEERSLNYIEQVLDKFPSHIGSLRLLRQIFMDKKAWSEAERTSLNIYKLTGLNKDLVGLLNLLNKQKKYQEALLFDKDEVDEFVLYEKSIAEFFLNNLDSSLELIEKAINLNPSYKKAQLLKSKILFKQNKEDEAREILESIEIDKDDADMLNFAGVVKQAFGDFKSAIGYFKEAVKVDSKNDEYYYNCASTYFKMGEIAYAKRFYNLAISLNPENKNYHFALANLHYSEKHYKRAMEELDYDFFEANLLKAIILYDTGYLALARKELDKLVLERPNDDVVLEYKKRIDEELKI